MKINEVRTVFAVLTGPIIKRKRGEIAGENGQTRHVGGPNLVIQGHSSGVVAPSESPPLGSRWKARTD